MVEEEEERRRKRKEKSQRDGFRTNQCLSYFIISTESMVGVDSVMLSDWVK